MRGVVGEHGAVSGIVLRFPASETETFSDAFFPFLLGEFFNVDGVDIHSIWVSFGLALVALVIILLCWVRVVRMSASDGICCIPLSFEVHGTGIPIFDCGGDTMA